MMITQTQQQLTELNKAYFEGRLSYSDYRGKRASVLDGLFEDITLPEDFSPKTVPMQKLAPQATPTANEASNKLIYVAIVTLVVCIAIATSFLMSDDPPQPTTISQTVEPALTSNQLQTLVEQSLSNNAWTPAQLSAIESGWHAMSAAERDNARQSHWYPKLTDTLDILASEQQALVDLGNTDAAAFEQQVIGLIKTLNNN